MQIIDLKLGQELYGIDIRYVNSIIVMQNITRVPKAQPYYLGVINLRGEVIPVMSLRRRLGLEDDVFTPSTRILILKPDDSSESVGLIVDEVNEVVTLEDDSIKKVNYDEKDEKAVFSAGIGKNGDELINILNVPAIVSEKNV
ncbi:purine-binding chemotaxis protein CheW [Herbinix hemicellulosilytica]|uniref:CheW-like domain-containing protein n=1 Tax=Herbinix hemicellulosilytica TaxID=1564487 RepID=A0A0H5SHL4_HERHM|nr:chemotaxis protein CheW [Herbinix hemicellulosilytica]RBP60845.1 purine-binding chemotaxis protein CheW [Herbinix hemicellulosilytica]CRZ34540.1 hypothetical protein HHT355_1339 [Herbinix hemicellulosilytica]